MDFYIDVQELYILGQKKKRNQWDILCYWPQNRQQTTLISPTKESEKTKTIRVFTRMSYRYNLPNIQPSSIYSTKKKIYMYI